MATTIVTKNNSIPGVVPSAGQLVQGELAVNVGDKRLYTLDAGNNVVLISSGSDYIVPVTIDVSSSSAALRVTQRGAGNALLVEDSTNPDSTPFVVDATGNVGIGEPSPSEKLVVVGNTSISGNLSFTTTGNRITGDFSNATLTNRVAILTSTVNGATMIPITPNGTGVNAEAEFLNNSDPTNASKMQIGVSNTEARINSGINGSGTYLPFTLYAGGFERARISTAGGFSVGTTSDPGAGAIYATGNITAFFSDDRLKTKLGKIENALDKLCSLDGFYYEPNETAQSLGYEAKRDVGISAQQMKEVLPEIVVPAPIDEKYMTVRYDRALPLIVEAIKELRAEIDAMKKGV